MAKRARKIEEFSKILEGHEIDKIEEIEISVLKELTSGISEISAPRDEAYIRHSLTDIIMITFFAVLSGANEWKEIEIFGNKKRKWLRNFLELRNGMPTDDTYRLVISKINANYVYEIMIGLLMKKVTEIVSAFDKGEIKKEREIISCDGKISNCSKRNETDAAGVKPLNTLNAYSSEWGLCLDQEFIEEKTNEITAMPKLLKRLDLENTIVTSDALNTQKEITETIIKGKGDYVLALKGSQKNFYEDVRDYFNEEALSKMRPNPDEKNSAKHLFYKMTIEKEHSGVVKREYFLEPEIEWLYGKEKWTGLKAIGLERKTIKKNNPKIEDSYENRYFISSIEDIEDYSRAVRGHWGVENSLHWQLDYTFKDDENTTTRNNGAEGLQIMKKIGLALIKFAQVAYPKRTSIKNIRFRLSLDFETEVEKIFTILNVHSLKERFFM
jgi:predicted transposase YbfD/YdcC